MPQAIPLPKNRYVQYLRSDREAPRREIARTHEIKGSQRHGLGVAFRLFGPHALVLGRWSPEALTAMETELLQREFPDWDGEDWHDLLTGYWSCEQHGKLDIECCDRAVPRFFTPKVEGEEREDNWGRLITAEEADLLAGRFSTEKSRKGWQPPIWSHHRYLRWVLPWLHRNYVITTPAAGSYYQWTPRLAVRVAKWRIANLFDPERFKGWYPPNWRNDRTKP